MRLIVLNTTRIGEKNLVVHSLCESWGRRSFLVTAGPKTPTALFLPLSILDAEVVENRKSELWRLRAVRSLYPLSGIRNNIFKNTISLFMSEVLYRTIRESTREDALLGWCEKVVLTLDSLESDFSNYHLWFLLELCSVLGFSADIESLSAFVGEHYSVVKRLLGCGFPDFLLVPLDGRSRNAIASAIVGYIGYHTETNLEVRSLKVLSEVFR